MMAVIQFLIQLPLRAAEVGAMAIARPGVEGMEVLEVAELVLPERPEQARPGKGMMEALDIQLTRKVLAAVVELLLLVRMVELMAAVMAERAQLL
jgi:hypothetical protein